MRSDFFEDNDEGVDFGNAFNLFMSTFKSGQVEGVSFSEEEYEYIIEKLIEQELDAETLVASRLAFEKYPYSSLFFLRYCDSLVLGNRVDQALHLLQEYKGVFSETGPLFFLYSRVYIFKGDFSKAREYYSMATAKDMVDDQTKDSIYALAQDCIEVQNFKEAIFYFGQIESKYSLPYEFHNDLAFCYDKLENPQKSIEHYNKYLDSDPFNDNVWFNIGTVLARTKDFDKAIEAFEYSIALNPSNSSSLYNLGVVFMNLQRYKEASEIFEQFMQVDNDVLARFALSEAYIFLGLPDKAKHLLRSTLNEQLPDIERNNRLQAIEVLINSYPVLASDMEFIEYVKKFNN